MSWAFVHRNAVLNWHRALFYRHIMYRDVQTFLQFCWTNKICLPINISTHFFRIFQWTHRLRCNHFELKFESSTCFVYNFAPISYSCMLPKLIISIENFWPEENCLYVCFHACFRMHGVQFSQVVVFVFSKRVFVQSQFLIYHHCRFVSCAIERYPNAVTSVEIR